MRKKKENKISCFNGTASSRISVKNSDVLSGKVMNI